MNNFYHKTCKSIIYIDISRYSRILVENLQINARSVKPVGQAYIRSEDGEAGFSFFCPECKKNDIPLSEIEIPCSHCGSMLSLGDAIKATGLSGAFCKKHIGDYSEGPTFTLLKALEAYFKEK